MKFRLFAKLFIYVLIVTVCYLVSLNAFVRREILGYFNVPNVTSPDQRPWYMKGGTIFPTYNENRETNSYNLIFPDDYPNNDRIPQQLMLMPSSVYSISTINSTIPIFSRIIRNIDFCKIEMLSFLIFTLDLYILSKYLD